jgi:hypothetical protein
LKKVANDYNIQLIFEDGSWQDINYMISL